MEKVTNMSDTITITPWPTEKACFCGFYAAENCAACGKPNAAFEIIISSARFPDSTDFKLCTDCLKLLHDEVGAVRKKEREMKQDDNCRQTHPGDGPGK